MQKDSLNILVHIASAGSSITHHQPSSNSATKNEQTILCENACVRSQFRNKTFKNYSFVVSHSLPSKSVQCIQYSPLIFPPNFCDFKYVC